MHVHTHVATHTHAVLEFYHNFYIIYVHVHVHMKVCTYYVAVRTHTYVHRYLTSPQFQLAGPCGRAETSPSLSWRAQTTSSCTPPLPPTVKELEETNLSYIGMRRMCKYCTTVHIVMDGLGTGDI